MNFSEILEQIQSELEQITEREQANQKEQAELTQEISQLSQNIEQLQQEIEAKYLRQSKLDQEALELCRRSEDLTEKKEKIGKIQSFSAEFQGLQAEFQGNKDLLNTLYSSISAIAPELEQPASLEYSLENSVFPPESERDLNFSLAIPTIKEKLANAEKLYQKLVAKHLDKYHTYQNQIIDGLDLIWCAVGFVAFGKESYRQMSLKYHPDRAGSEQAMQLINTAWEIAREHLDIEQEHLDIKY